MQLQQLRYVVSAAESGSFRAAAQKLFVSQSSISIAVKDLEQELGTTLFTRTSRGIALTTDGRELIGFAKPILDQFDEMTRRYSRERDSAVRFAVSSLHNLLVAKAFGDFISAHGSQACNFSLRETYTNQIIRDVQEGTSDLGVIYMSRYNEQSIRHVLEEGGLFFTPLFIAQPHVVIGENHPLADNDYIKPEQLAPYDRYELEQGFEASPYFMSEPISQMPHKRKITLSDNSSLAAILARNDGYALATGISPANRTLALVPLDTEETMEVGYLSRHMQVSSALATEFLIQLSRQIVEHGDDITPTQTARLLASK